MVPEQFSSLPALPPGLQYPGKIFRYFVPLLRCSILGILFFILLFEGRSRYLILYLPCFSLLSGWALSQLSEFLQKALKKASPPRTAYLLYKKQSGADTYPEKRKDHLHVQKAFCHRFGNPSFKRLRRSFVRYCARYFLRLFRGGGPAGGRAAIDG